MKLLTPEQLYEIRERHDAEPRYRNSEPTSMQPHTSLCYADKDRQDLLEHITALEAEGAKLVKHTTHLDGCRITYTNDGPKMCSCGLAELLKQESES